MNKERIEFLEKQIRENAGTATAVFLNKWLGELKTDEWHDINDCFPSEEGKDYLVTLSDGTVAIDSLAYEDDCFFFDNYHNFEDVIAWKELPKPYKKGDK